MRRWQIIVVSIFASFLPLGYVGIAQALYSSPHYEVNEVFFGSGGDLSIGSTNYSAKVAVGETGVGNTSSTHYQANSGFNTTDEPFLEFVVNTSSINLGVLSDATTSTANGTFLVKDYLSQGYVVQTDSPPPASSTHTLTALTTPTLSSVGTEQFGMNLVANTLPTAFGAVPVQQPNSSFSFGTVVAGSPGPNGKSVATGYDTPNHYTYNNGDIIAASNQSSGETDYTISYIFNISSLTPDGVYTFQQVLVATATY